MTWGWMVGTVVYLLIGTFVAAKTMDDEMVVAPSQGFLWFYFVTRAILWPFLFLR